jgi:dTDP-4-amino-4,6-dideoxygalactose transaminase
MQRIPLCDLARQAKSIEPELQEAWTRVVRSGHYILGPEVEAFELEAAKFLQVRGALGVASGTDAIWLALRACGIGPGDAVLTSPFTFFATVSAIVNTGATPVFADIDPITYNLSPELVKTQFENKKGRAPPKAVLPVHLYGQPASMAKLVRVAEENGARLIEDSAQAFGARVGDTPVGGIGDLGCFSFFPTKNLGAFGDGGLVVAKDPALLDRISLLRGHGSRPKYHHQIVGTNSRLDAMQAAFLRVKLRHLDRWNAARREIARRYSEDLQEVPFIGAPTVAAGTTHTFHQYTIRVSNGLRDSLAQHLTASGIETSIYYPGPAHLQPATAYLGHRPGDFPQAEQAAKEVLSLPMFPELAPEEADRVVVGVKDFMNKRG